MTESGHSHNSFSPYVDMAHSPSSHLKSTLRLVEVSAHTSVGKPNYNNMQKVLPNPCDHDHLKVQQDTTEAVRHEW